MPRGIATYIPFPSRISPDVERAKACHLEWPRSFALLLGKDAERRHLQGSYPELAGRFHPAATGADLDLGVDQMSWFFIFDDQFDFSFGENPERAKRITDAVTDVLALEPNGRTTNDSPIVRAFAHLWARSREGMSETWCRRASKSWRAYLAGHVAEAANRNRPSPPLLSDQLVLRRETSGVFPILDLAERLGHFEVPERAFHSATLTEMRLIAAEVVVLDNEIFSLEKEEAIGDRNLVLTLEHDTHCSRAQAIETICGMIRERNERFVTLERQLGAICEGLGLDEVETSTVLRYTVDAVRTVMRGAHDWQQHSDRYSAAYLPVPETYLFHDMTG